jgi:GntR family transcriptional repressor for pyruvate dehydrogenase complex
MSESARFPRPLQRTRLYEQVAEQITAWISENDLKAGDRLPPERQLATSLGVSRATLSQALVALEVIGVVAVRHGDGTVLTDKPRAERITDAIRAHAERIPDVIEARDALETKIAALAAQRRTQEDLDRIEAALRAMADDVDGGGRGVQGDELFHRAVTEAAHSPLLERMMSEISELIRETRIESLSQPDRPRTSLAGHQRIADAITSGDAEAAAAAMHGHVMLVSDVALLRD